MSGQASAAGRKVVAVNARSSNVIGDPAGSPRVIKLAIPCSPAAAAAGTPSNMG
jgi:hypothetical protein